MTGGEAVVQTLVSEGVTAVFGLPGTHALALFDALHDAPDIRRITTRHEQGAAYMADGYARASGNIGVCLFSTGPGAVNSLSAMGTAFGDSSPVLNISSQIPSEGIERGRGYFHDVGDQLGMFSSVTGWRTRAGSPTEIPWLVHEAMNEMRNGRPRPAALEVPKDVLDATADVTVPLNTDPTPLVPDSGQIEAAAQALRKARRPAIWAGGGAITGVASKALVELAETLQAPVFTTVTGKGAIPERHPLSVVVPPAHDRPTHQYLADCDLLLVIGSHMGQLDTNEWTVRMPGTIVQIDVDPAEIGRNYPVEVAVVGDAGTSVRALVQAVGGARGERTSRTGEVAELKSKFREKMRDRSTEAVELIDQVQSAVGRDGIVVGDVTTAAAWAYMLLEVDGPRSFLYPWGLATLGAGFPMAMGASVARPDRKVLAICGDGGFMFTCAELATAVQFGINIVALVVNDSKFGILEPQQMARFGRTTMTDLHNPDFAAMAESFGALGVTVGGVDEVGSALLEAFAADRPAVVEIRTSLPHPYDTDW
jgi:acetolactate synthase-1/2/3 large subunit